MKKIICACFIFIFSVSYATEMNTVDIQNFANTMKDFNNEITDGYDYENMIEDIKKGEFDFDYRKIFDNAGKLLIKEVRSNIGLAVQIIIIALLIGFLDSLKANFTSEGVSQIAFYVCYILLITLIVASFTQIYNIAYDVLKEIERFMNVLIPIIIGLIVSTGGFTISSMIYPILAFSTQFVSFFMTGIVLPVSMIAFALGVISNISNKVTVSRIPSLLKSFAMWSMGIILTIFVGVLSLEGTIASTVDGVTIKAAKFLFAGSVPVVGKLLGDSVDAILGSTLIVKDSVGFVGIAVLFGLALTPIIKILIVTCIYSGTAAIIEPFSDKRICKCLNDTAGAAKMILGVVITVFIMLMLAMVMLLKMTNSVAMYR